MPMLIPAIYIAVLVAAAVVLAFILECVSVLGDAARTPVSAAADERRWPNLDQRVMRRLAVVGGAAALAVAAAIITGYSVDAQRTSLLLAWPGDHPASCLLAGIVLCLVALLCGVKLRQDVLLFCLTLPGLVIMPLLLLLPDIMRSHNVVEAALAYPIIWSLQPGVLILLFIGIGQATLLHKPGGNFTPGGFVRLLLILVAYVYGFILSGHSASLES
jgi:hypothetical protein